MGTTQKENLFYWSGVFKNILIGLSGALLLLLYTDMRDDDKTNNARLQHTVDEIKSELKEISTATNKIDSRVYIIEYRLNEKR